MEVSWDGAELAGKEVAADEMYHEVGWSSGDKSDGESKFPAFTRLRTKEMDGAASGAFA